MEVLIPGATLGDYLIIEPLDEKTPTTVWLAKQVVTNLKVVIKILPKKNVENPDTRTRFNREMSLQRSINFPFIAQFYELLEDDANFYFVMEYAQNGTMLNHITSGGRIPEVQARHYFCQIIGVLDYLHNSKFIDHRNLNSGNVLLDRNNTIRIMNFRLSNVFTETSLQFKTVCGNPSYAAPEMIQRQPYTRSTDIWAAGILLFFMVTGDLPYEDENSQRLLQKIVYTDVIYPQYLSPPLVDLLKKILDKNPETRATLETIIHHPWFSIGEYRIIHGFVTPESTLKVIDNSILQTMKKYNFDISSLFQSLKVGEFTALTAIYRELLKDNITTQLKSLPDLLNNVVVSNDNHEQRYVKAKFSSTYTQIPQTKITETNVSFSQSGALECQPRKKSLKAITPAPDQKNTKSSPHIPVCPRPRSMHLPTTQRMVHVPAPVQIANRKLSRPAANRKTLDLSSVNLPDHYPDFPF